MFLEYKKVHNCIIIGSGPAGYSASIYAARSELNPIIFTGDQPGGQLTTTTSLDNFLGFPNGINGVDFMENCKKQAKRFNVKIVEKTITKVTLSYKKGGIHYIFFGEKYIKSRGLIIATGSTPNFLGLKKEKKFVGLGISFCSICDGFFHKNKVVAVVGGGDTALEEANYLSKICKKVFLLVRKNYFKASKILQNIINKKNNICVLFNTSIVEIIGKDFLEEIKIYNKQKQNYKTISISGLFIAIGHIPNTKIFSGKINLDKNGFILVDTRDTSTNIPGVFAAGDVQDINYKQAITSAGTGCMAAIDLDKYLYSINKKKLNE